MASAVCETSPSPSPLKRTPRPSPPTKTAAAPNRCRRTGDAGVFPGFSFVFIRVPAGAQHHGHARSELIAQRAKYSGDKRCCSTEFSRRGRTTEAISSTLTSGSKPWFHRGKNFGWEAWTRTRIPRVRVWCPTNWTTSQPLEVQQQKRIAAGTR